MLPTIVVIRAKDEGLARGQGVVEVPILKPIPNDEELGRLRELCMKRWDVVVFMSTTAVKYAYDVVKQPCWVRCMAVGPSTRAVVEEYFHDSCLVPNEYSSMGLLQMLRHIDGKVLVLRSMEHALDLFKELGDRVVELGLYGLTLINEELAKLKELLSEVESSGVKYAVVVTSPRVAREVSSMLTNLRNAIIVAIGPVTSRELDRLNIPHRVAAVHTIDGAMEEARLALRELNKGYG